MSSNTTSIPLNQVEIFTKDPLSVGYVLYFLHDYCHVLYIVINALGKGASQGVEDKKNWGSFLCLFFGGFRHMVFSFSGFVAHGGFSHGFVVSIMEL